MTRSTNEILFSFIVILLFNNIEKHITASSIRSSFSCIKNLRTNCMISRTNCSFLTRERLKSVSSSTEKVSLGSAHFTTNANDPAAILMMTRRITFLHVFLFSRLVTLNDHYHFCVFCVPFRRAGVSSPPLSFSLPLPSLLSAFSRSPRA